MTTTTTDTRFDDPTVRPVYLVTAQPGPLGFTSPPASTTPNTDTPVAFATTAYHVVIQNSTAAVVYVELDAAASPGSLALAVGQVIFLDVQCNTVHLYTVAAEAINGSAATNIVIRGWS